MSAVTDSFIIITIYNNNYYSYGDLVATLPFQPYLYWNIVYNRVEFIDLNTGNTYAFAGSNQNKFVFSSRYIEYTGYEYYNGWAITPTGNGLGFTTTLLWNGSYYQLLSVVGNGTPF